MSPRAKGRKKSTGKRTRRGGRKKSQEPLLERDQQLEILAFALLALAALVLLALLPTGWFGVRAADWFPSGNVIGSFGGWIRGVLVGAVGWSGVLVPGLLIVAGLRAGDWWDRVTAARAAVLVVGLLAILPLFLQVTVAGPSPGGAYGVALAEPAREVLGVVGVVLVCLVALVALSVATLRWNPVRPLGRAVVTGGRAVVSGGEALTAAARRAHESLRIAGEEEPFEVEEEEWEEEEWEEEEEPPDEEVAPPPPRAPRGRRSRKKKKDPPEPEPEPDLPDPAGAAPPWSSGDLPPLSLLDAPVAEDRRGMEEQLEELGEILVDKLRSFNVECALGDRTTGPVVTQFEVVPAPGVKVNRISSLDADLALAMKAESIRIVAPIPGKGAVGVEIPNPLPQVVKLREILESPSFQRSRAGLPLALGHDLTGRAYVSDLAKMPHVLIAGATGSGKSVCLNTIITSLVVRHTPETLRLLLIDPKMVELSTYADLPHLRHSVVTDPRDAAGVLKWAVMEMERRYALLSANGVRSLAEFNRRHAEGVVLRRPDADGPEGDPDRFIYEDGPLPYVVLVVDELADLMMTVQADVEKPLAQLAQKARAIGIHLIVATQRPSVNVITGLIKANFPTRIAFRVASKTDSRTILDQNGADALLGNGDMLFLPPGKSEPVRMQGAFISTEETDDLMAWFRARRDERRAALEAGGAEDGEGEEDILEAVRELEHQDGSEVDPDATDRDKLFRDAAEVCIQNQQASTSLLQRKLKIGYGRAARIMDQLQDAGVVGPPAGSTGREVLVGLDALDLIESS